MLEHGIGRSCVGGYDDHSKLTKLRWNALRTCRWRSVREPTTVANDLGRSPQLPRPARSWPFMPPTRAMAAAYCIHPAFSLSRSLLVLSASAVYLRYLPVLSLLASAEPSIQCGCAAIARPSRMCMSPTDLFPLSVSFPDQSHHGRDDRRSRRCPPRHHHGIAAAPRP